MGIEADFGEEYPVALIVVAWTLDGRYNGDQIEGQSDDRTSTNSALSTPNTSYVQGRVTQSGEEMLTIETLDGQQQQFQVVQDADIRLNGEAVDLEDLEAGQQVGIEQDMQDGQPVALIVEAWTQN